MKDMNEKIMDTISKSEHGISSGDIAKKLNIDRHTVSKYLEVMKTMGLINFRKAGMTKLWYVNDSPLLSTLKDENHIGKNIRNLLNSLGGMVNVLDKDKKIVFRSKNNFMKCSKVHKKGEKCCKECSVDKTFKTGKRGQGVGLAKDQDGNRALFEVITVPIKDHKNETVAVMEFVKSLKEIKR